MDGLRIECNLCDYIGVSGERAHDCNPARQIRILRAQLAEVTRERDAYRAAIDSLRGPLADTAGWLTKARILVASALETKP